MTKADAILVSDTHIRATVPSCRIDDFITSMWNKWEEILTISENNGGCPILHGGDLGEYSEWPDILIRTFIRACRSIKAGPIIVVPGQHDLPSHNVENWEKTPLGILDADGTIVCLHGKSRTPYVLSPKIEIYDFPWGVDLGHRRFQTIRKTPGIRNVAISHQLTMEGKDNKADFPGNAEFGINLLKKCPQFDLILTGDNHKTFVIEYEGRILVNPGSMMRSTAAQIEHQPSIFLWYAKQNMVTQHILKFENGVVSRKHIEETKEKEKRMEAFIQSIQDGEVLSISFENNMTSYLQKNKVSDIIVNKVWECVQ